MRKRSLQIFLFFIVPCTALFAQLNYDLSKLETLTIVLKAKGGDLFFPVKYEELQNRITALNTYSPEDSQPDLEGEFEQIENELYSWIDQTESTRKYLINVLDTRQNALHINADSFAPDIFSDGEKKLREAAYHHQNNSLSHAEYSAGEARTYYQNSEIETIRNHLMGEIRIQFQESVDLGAPAYAPETYAYTRTLLQQTEQMLKAQAPDYQKLSNSSLMLYQSVKKLNILTKVTAPIYKGEGNAESYILSLGEQIANLSKKINASTNTKTDLNAILDDLLLEVQNLIDQKNHLELRNQQLEYEKQDLERELLSFKNIADQRLYLDRKINRVRTILSGNVKEQGTFLILQMDSLMFNENEHSLRPEGTARLSRIIDALGEFPEHPYVVRYVQHSSDNVIHDQAIANMRAESIKKFIKSHLLFADNQIESLGLVYKGEAQDHEFDIPQMEILVDLKSYLTFNVGRPAINAD